MNYIPSSLKKFDYNSSNSRLFLSFLIPTVLFIIISPGVFFEIEDKPHKSSKIKYKTAAFHAIIFGVLNFLIYYFYLRKPPTGMVFSSKI